MPPPNPVGAAGTAPTMQPPPAVTPPPQAQQPAMMTPPPAMQPAPMSAMERPLAQKKPEPKLEIHEPKEKTPEVDEYQGPRGGPITLGPVTVNAAIEEDAAISFDVKGKEIEIKIALVFKIVASFLMLIYVAFPMISVGLTPNPFGKSGSSALQATVGCNVFGGFIFPVFLLFIPLAMLLAFILKDKVPTIQDMLEDGLYKLMALICAAGLFFLIITAIIYVAVVSGSLTLGVDTYTVTAHPFAIGFILSFILYALCGGISYLCIMSQNKILTAK